MKEKDIHRMYPDAKKWYLHIYDGETLFVLDTISKIPDTIIDLQKGNYVVLYALTKEAIEVVYSLEEQDMFSLEVGYWQV